LEKKETKAKPFFVLQIDSPPISQQRPRFSKNHVFNPQAQLKEQYGWIFKHAMMQQHKNCTAKPLIVQLVCAFKKTKSSPKHCTKHIDIDNICKFYLDCMQPDIVYQDDSQITQLNASKIYSPKPYVNITIWEL